MCIVELSELTLSNVLERLKLMLHIRALLLPRRNCQSFFASGTLKTRTTVPLSEAVASMVPVELRARQAMGVLCAWITFRADSVMVSNSSTSPVVGAGGAGGMPEDRGEDEADGAGEG